MRTEAYFLGNKDSRTGIAYHAIKKAIDTVIKIYMFMPNIEEPKKILDNQELSEKFCEFKNFRSLSSRNHSLSKHKRREWFELNHMNGKILILDKKKNFFHWGSIFQNLKEASFNKDYLEVIKFLENEFGSNYIYLNLLKKGIVVSNGRVPKIFRFYSELFYKNNIVEIMLANSTVTKGVNLHPDCIGIFASSFDRRKNSLDVFELRNALGRAGRYSYDIQKRVGNVDFVFGDNKKLRKEFQDKEAEYTSDSIKKVSWDEENNNKITFNYKFGRKNIDWVNIKFGLQENIFQKEIKENREILLKYLENKYRKKTNDFDNMSLVWKF